MRHTSRSMAGGDPSTGWSTSPARSSTCSCLNTRTGRRPADSFTQALRVAPGPADMTTDRAAAYPRVVDELLPAARHVTQRHANNPLKADHGRLKAPLRPMRGLKRDRSVRIVAKGSAFVQNL